MLIAVTTLPASTGADAVSALLGFVDSAVVLADRTGAITGWSRGAESLLGHNTAAVTGRHCADLYAIDEREAHRARCHSVLASNRATEFEATVFRASGELLAVHVELRPLRGADGQPEALLCHLRAATSHYSANPDAKPHQLQAMLKLVDRAPIAFTLLDANRRFVYANQAALKLLPTPSKDVIGRHLRDVLGEEKYNAVLTQVDDALMGNSSTSELEAVDADGQKIHLYRYVYPDFAPDGSVAGYFSALLDFTRTKVSQERQIRQEHALRATLVREINHRIKNSLQGIIGMMRFHTSQHTPAPMIIEQCVAQLMAVGVAFGLASRHGEAQVLLCDMVLEIAHNVEQVSQRRIQVDLSSAAVRRPVALSERHGANISLVVNELIFNALKHSATLAGSRSITVRVDRNDTLATVSVTNESGVLPPGFSLQTGQGLGTGLTLIKALIPSDSCELRIFQEDRGVTALLTLKSPVLSLGVTNRSTS